MRRILAAAAVGAAAALAFAAPAQADDKITVESDCLQGWYVNPDEGDPAHPDNNGQGDRRPTSTEDGLVFKDNQLVHHAVKLPVGDLEPGTYVAEPEPASPSFFSVEIWNDDGSGYGTLRWVNADNVWSLTTGGQTYTDADPAKLVADHGKATTVRSFGVGYTNAPRDYPETTVSSITFAGETYDLTCKESPNPPAAGKPTAAPASPGAGAGAAGGGKAEASLPVTGASVPVLGGVAALLLVGGGAAMVVSRRRRTRFTA